MDSPETALVPLEPDWNVIQDRYVDGESCAVLSEEYGVTVAAIQGRANRGKWKDQQIKRVEKEKAAIESEVRGSIIISILREARMYRLEAPPADPAMRDAMSRCRERLISASVRMFGWERDALDEMKRVKAIDV